MPKVNYPVRSAAHEAGAKHNIGTIFQNRCKKDGILARVILHVGVLHDNQVTRSCLKPGAQCCSLPEIAFLE